MIETAMIFALGFLAASLCGLMVLPAVNARAARLSRRRAEAMLPLTPAEIAAERDFLRAQFAVQQRRLERTVETVRATRHADMAAIGAGTMRAAALTRDVADRDAEIARAQAKRLDLEAELAAAREDAEGSLATLLALEDAHADLLDSLLALRQGNAVHARTGAGPEADAGADPHAGGGLGDRIERENADLRRRIVEVADALARRGSEPVAEPVPLREPAET